MWKSLILPLVAAVFPLGSAQNMDEVNVSKGGTLSGPGLASMTTTSWPSSPKDRPCSALTLTPWPMAAGPTAS
jgi:hypothetical protein